MRGLTADIRANGVVRAFEPGQRPDGKWRCRGRVASPHRETDGKLRKTAQCNTTLRTGQKFCGRCGGLIAWGGVAIYKNQDLRHLERAPA